MSRCIKPIYWLISLWYRFKIRNDILYIQTFIFNINDIFEYYYTFIILRKNSRGITNIYGKYM